MKFVLRSLIGPRLDRLPISLTLTAGFSTPPRRRSQGGAHAHPRLPSWAITRQPFRSGRIPRPARTLWRTSRLGCGLIAAIGWPRRTSRAGDGECLGELVQIDGSEHAWFQARGEDPPQGALDGRCRGLAPASRNGRNRSHAGPDQRNASPAPGRQGPGSLCSAKHNVGRT
jgi:hypothetical protein